MGFFVRDCVRCGTRNVVHHIHGESVVRKHSQNHHELVGACADCRQYSVYVWYAPTGGQPEAASYNGNVADFPGQRLSEEAVRIATTAVELSEFIPERIANLFREANECRQMTWYEAAGAMYRKTLDVATKHIYAHDSRLIDRQPAQALRVRIKSLGEMKILDDDIVELADVAALDGNDATHDVDPYTKDEAEALEDLTFDLLERLFVRPAKIAAVKAKQIAAGVRPA
ncbi:DUF4145 domain-containing protein [Rhizobium changzhiense]|uniref:DUF4145 domain-containing protein n=1 Tax=Rhizobium changzhiense TaxID=2692317 RepID=UPI001F0C09E4|nr:DUF4145 domain-containing protein [Rhizobium changzhiense]MCH4548248.1 DUF4145 domain-containing protein [Rhizobium changzhiense]